MRRGKSSSSWRTIGEYIEAFYPPGYSPELNPDERLNAGLKHALGSGAALRAKAKLKAAA